MTRCDDGIFYRVFCVTLLAIAFTFTVILSNVFIDIDGLLSHKGKGEKDKSHKAPIHPHEMENNEVFYKPDVEGLEANNEVSDEFRFDSNDPDSYRTKRSLDTQNFKFHIKNPKMKQILTNKLSTLLEELDNEETKTRKTDKNKAQQQTAKGIDSHARKNNQEKEMTKSEDEMLHLAMHNILLQGIIGHMDLNEVYKKVHMLVKSFDQDGKKTDIDAKELLKKKTDNSAEALSQHNLFSVESKFFEELSNCDDLQQQIFNSKPVRMENTRRLSGDAITMKNDKKAPQMLIKTIIDIKTLKNDKHNRSEINEKNIKGLIKLIYNGHPINFGRLDDEEEKNHGKEVIFDDKLEKEIKRGDVDIFQDDGGNMLDTYLDKAIGQYLKKYPALEKKYKSKRLKRSVKVREHVQITTTENPNSNKKDEDELYVEIETHFDSKGIKGEKKKKLIKNLVEKIQKAIHTNIDSLQEKKKSKTFSEFKKRFQSPLDQNPSDGNILRNKILIPFDKVVHRNSEPINSKTIKLTEPATKVADKTGNDWKQTYFGSNFLSGTKSINSGEKGLVDLDYSNVLKSTGIPQRLQQPLNTDNIEDNVDDPSFFDLGDLKFYIKDIDGTGFSIGFNQYVGEVPDPESIKLFTGLQQLIKAYHSNYDEGDSKNGINEGERTDGTREVNHEVTKREVGKSKEPTFGSFDDGGDYHSNEYKIVFDNHFLPYDSYSQIFEDQDKKVTLSIQKQNAPASLNDVKPMKTIKAESIPLILDENLFKKHLKPSEIFGLASLINRKKRSAKVKVQRYTNLNIKTKTKINRFINTDKMSHRFDKVKSKRSKRQIDKIRIIAGDNLTQLPRHSDENVFVVSDENMFADRAVVREVDIPEQETLEPPDDRIDYINARQVYEHASQPYQYSQFSPQHQFGNIFTARSRQNALMSKYPHLFLEEIARSKEEDNPLFYSKLLGSYGEFQKNNEMTTPSYLATPVPVPQYASPELRSNPTDILDSKPNYKLTVKVFPKNNSDVHSGFKEIHTSINKSINKNGLIYSSQVNVSEVSKIENIKDKKAGIGNNNPSGISMPETPSSHTFNATAASMALVESNTEKSSDPQTSYIPLVRRIKEQQEKMKQLLKQHRQRIDDQLDTLKKEKLNIESIIVPDGKKPDMIDVMLPLNPPQMLHLNKAEAGQLITSALMKLHDVPQLNDVGIPQQLITNLSTPPKETSTTHPTSTTTTQKPLPKMEPEKLKLLKTIQRNENLTSAILFKLDTNTNLLQSFLQKISEKLESSTPPILRTEFQEPSNLENLKPKDHVYPKDWKYPPLHNPFFNQAMPNFEASKNATHVSIPFVYAYQQPYHMPNKPNGPVASIIYQGHIHTNANYENSNFKKPELRLQGENKKLIPDIKREVNQSRFFYDDIENEFKFLQQDYIKKHIYDIHRIKNNATRI